MDASANAAQAAVFGGAMVWVFVVAGFILGVVAVGLIIANKPVTTGHTVMIVAAFGLAVAPYISNVEFGEKGLNLKMREGAVEIARNMQELAKTQQQQSEAIEKLAAELKVAVDNIQALRSAAPEGGPVSQLPALDPDVVEKLKGEAEKISKSNETVRNAAEQLLQDFKDMRGF